MSIYERSYLFWERIKDFAVKNNMTLFTAKQKSRLPEQPRLPNTQEITDILLNIKDLKSYFAGGTLCVDKILDDSDVLIMNLDGTYGSFCNSSTGTLTYEQRQRLFDIYKETKGETDYYKTQLKSFKNII